MTAAGEKKYWYNMRTATVEFGFQSPSVDRVGPFDTAEQALNAPAKLRENSNRWAAEDAAAEENS